MDFNIYYYYYKRVITQKMNIYDADISIYKYYRTMRNTANNADLIKLTKSLIYQNYWCDCVMYEFLRCNEDIETVIDRIQIKSWYRFYLTGYLW